MNVVSAFLRLPARHLSVVFFAGFAAHALAQTDPASIPAPDGAPALAADTRVSHATVVAPEGNADSVVVHEARIQGRLASAQIRVAGGRGYTVVDPTVGRADRQPDNGGRRVSPSVWQLFRF